MLGSYEIVFIVDNVVLIPFFEELSFVESFSNLNSLVGTFTKILINPYIF